MADISTAIKIEPSVSQPRYSDYPYTPYPPFKDPEDWRSSLSNKSISERDLLRIREIVTDVAEDHAAKHQRHDHPWCTKCWHQFAGFMAQVDGHFPVKTRAELETELDAKNPRPLAPDKRRLLEQMVSEGWSVREEDAETYGVDYATLQMWEAYFDGLANIEDLRVNAEQDCLLRVNRYLLLHGKAPADSFDPEASTETLHDELLDREDLDELPAPEWQMAGILTRHAYAVLRGRRSTYKSFLVLDWALCLVTGRSWMGRASERLRVLYVVGEGAYGVAARVRAWEAANTTEIPVDDFKVLPRAINLYRGSQFDELLRVVEEGRYGLVVFDTLRRMTSGADSNTDKDMGLVIDRLERIKRATADGSVLVVAHTDKGDNSTRGSSAIEDDADIVWNTKADDYRLELTCSKMKDGPDGERIELSPQPVADSLVLQPFLGTPHEDSTESQRLILDTLHRLFSTTGASSAALREATGLPKSTYYLALNLLKATGHVLNSGSKTRPHYELPPAAQSNESKQGPTQEQGSDQGESNESNEFNSDGQWSSPVQPLYIGLDVGPNAGPDAAEADPDHCIVCGQALLLKVAGRDTCAKCERLAGKATRTEAAS